MAPKANLLAAVSKAVEADDGAVEPAVKKDRRGTVHVKALASDESSEETEQLLVEVQAKSRYFRGFLDDVPKLAETLSVVDFEQGETILQRGEEGTWVGLVLSGELEVVIEGKAVATVGAGDFLGEMIIWYGGVRQSTVMASESGVIATILVSELKEMCLENPELCTRLFHAIGQQSVTGWLAFQTRNLQEKQKKAGAWGLKRVPLQEASAKWAAALEKLKARGFDPPEQAVEALMNLMEVHSFQEGDKLLMPGDAADQVMLLIY